MTSRNSDLHWHFLNVTRYGVDSGVTECVACGVKMNGHGGYVDAYLPGCPGKTPDRAHVFYPDGSEAVSCGFCGKVATGSTPFMQDDEWWQCNPVVPE